MASVAQVAPYANAAAAPPMTRMDAGSGFQVPAEGSGPHAAAGAPRSELAKERPYL